MTKPPGLNPDFRLDTWAMQPGPEEDLPLSVRAAQILANKINTDHKTGLFNETAWNRQLEDAIESMNLDGGDGLIVYVTDVDGFRTVNNELGHSAGDELLGVVAEVLRRTFQRKSDISAHGSRESGDSGVVARLGGDEFAVFSVRKASDAVIYHRSSAMEIEVSHQSRQSNEILSELLRGTKYEKFGINLSIGSAAYEDGDTADILFARADIAMFEAKSQGKIDGLSQDDINDLHRIIPFLHSKGARVDSWLVQAVHEHSQGPS